jgi:ESCRT-I complex subunit TSG101
LEEKCEKIKNEICKFESNSKINPQDIIQPSNPIYKQIFNAHAREQALEDSIYHMNKALSRGTIDCDTFLRYVRIFAREQFEQKETVMKAREVARLRN